MRGEEETGKQMEKERRGGSKEERREEEETRKRKERRGGNQSAFQPNHLVQKSFGPKAFLNLSFISW